MDPACPAINRRGKGWQPAASWHSVLPRWHHPLSAPGRDSCARAWRGATTQRGNEPQIKTDGEGDKSEHGNESSFPAQAQRVEARVVVENVQPLFPLEEIDGQVGEGGDDDLVGGLEQPLRHDGRPARRRGWSLRRRCEMNTSESRPSPTRVEPMVRVHSQRPRVTIFSGPGRWH
jgi:hypothetical protein